MKNPEAHLDEARALLHSIAARDDYARADGIVHRLLRNLWSVSILALVTPQVHVKRKRQGQAETVKISRGREERRRQAGWQGVYLGEQDIHGGGVLRMFGRRGNDKRRQDTRMRMVLEWRNDNARQRQRPDEAQVDRDSPANRVMRRRSAGQPCPCASLVPGVEELWEWRASVCEGPSGLGAGLSQQYAACAHSGRRICAPPLKWQPKIKPLQRHRTRPPPPTPSPLHPDRRAA